METVKEFLARTSIPDTKWIEEAQQRQKNEAWLWISAQIAYSVLEALDAKNMTQRELAAILECSPQYVSKIVKGSENLTLETICKLEKALDIKLISSAFQERKIETEPHVQ